MKQPSFDSGFEQYRRQRQRRRLESGEAHRPMPSNEEVLRELEQAEAAEVQDQRLTREVHEFFADATKTAATIVQKVSDNQREESALRLGSEMQQFLMETMRRVEGFVTTLRSRDQHGIAEQVIEVHMHNLVGPVLDSFRNEGTAQLDDKHIGQDPTKEPLFPGMEGLEELAGDVPLGGFANLETEDEEEADGTSGTGPRPVYGGSPAPGAPDREDELEDHLATRVGLDEEEGEAEEPPRLAPAGTAPAAEPVPTPAPQPKPAPAPDTAQHPLLRCLGTDADKWKLTLKLLVKGGVVGKDEALEIFRATFGGGS